MDPKTLAITPTKFSGPYFVEKIDSDSAVLKRNVHSLINQWFPSSSRTIRLKAIPLAAVDDALLKREIDLVIRLHTGRRDLDWSKDGIERRTTSASGIVHFYGLGNVAHPPIGRDFIESAWNENQDPVLVPADSFLPFASASYGLKPSELIAELPKHTAKEIRVLCPNGYYTKALIDQIERAANAVGSHMEFIFVPSSEWYAAMEDPHAHEKYDYLLAIYAASERYPAVQLRYLTNHFVKPEIDLKKAEIPDLGREQIELLRNYQKWLLRTRQAIPVYFTVTEFLHQKNIDIGEQPASDAEIELWRVQERKR